jgi:pyrimidine operon attenuation protein/uracil phosphoribosyltransferase
MTQNIILNHQEIEHKIRRIAYQIYETFVEEKEIVLAGISKNGFVFAQKLAIYIENISDLKVTLCEVSMDKENPFAPVNTTLTLESIENKGLILVDDVLNSGTTLVYGVKHFLNIPLKKFKTAVLVDRNHKKYPVKADFKGISLSTSLKEHVHVVFQEGNNYAYLN